MKIDLCHQHRAVSSLRHMSDFALGVVSVGSTDLVVTVKSGC